MIALAFLRTTLGPLFSKAAPYALILLFYVVTLGGTFWAGYTIGLSASRADASKALADTLAATLAAQRVTADLMTADRERLEKSAAMIDKQAVTIRQLTRKAVQNENLQGWYNDDANSVESLAFYGVPPTRVPRNATPDIRRVPDPADPAAVSVGTSDTGTIH